MISVPVKLAPPRFIVPTTFILSCCVPPTIPPISMANVVDAFSVEFPFAVTVPGLVPGEIVPPVAWILAVVPEPPRTPPARLSGAFGMFELLMTVPELTVIVPLKKELLPGVSIVSVPVPFF